jgi:hypothetical protein
MELSRYYTYPKAVKPPASQLNTVATHLPSTCKHIWIRAEVTSKPPRGTKFEIGVDAR